MAKMKIGRVKGIDLLKSSKNKLGTHLPEVSRGCGTHGDKKYNRRKAKKFASKEIDRGNF
jgi:hypothetical protein